MGFIGANLAFALDVKAIGVLTPSGAKDSGWTAWDNILKSPFIKTAKGYISGTFDNIGRSFVEMWTKKTKGSSATNAVNELENFGKGQITKLGTSYLKALALTTFTTGANELAGALGCDWAKWSNTGAASNNLNTKGDARAFNSDDANFMSMDEFNKDKEDKGAFVAFINSLGMFDASPKLVDRTAATSSLEAPWEFIKIPAVAIQNLSDPKYLGTVINNFVWGGSEFKGEGIGISHIVGGMVDSAIGAFKPQQPKNGSTDEYAKAQQAFEVKREELAARLEKELTDEIRVQLGLKKAEVIAVLQAWAQNPNDPKFIPNFPDLTEQAVTAWDTLEKGADILNIWKNMQYLDPVQGLVSIKTKAQKELGLDDNQFNIFYAKSCNALNPQNIQAIINQYFEEQENIEPVLMNAKFIGEYIATNGFINGAGLANNKFKIDAAITGATDLFIPLNEDIPNLSLTELYAQWGKWKKANNEPVKYEVVAFLKDAAIHNGDVLTDPQVTAYLSTMYNKSDEEKIKFFSDHAGAVKAALGTQDFLNALDNEDVVSELIAEDVLKVFRKYEFWKSNNDALTAIGDDLVSFKTYLTNPANGNPVGDAIAPAAVDNFVALQEKLGRTGKTLFKYYFDSRLTISKMLKDGSFGDFIKNVHLDVVTDGRYRELMPLYNEYKAL